jgi:FkbM family methyltransferase
VTRTDDRFLAGRRRIRLAYGRRRYPGLDAASRELLEAVEYRRSMFDFMGATHRDPAILFEASIDADSTVVDAGAFVGEWTEEISRRYAPRVVAFEPAPMYWRVLQERVGSSPGVTCRQCALGRTDGTAVLSLDGPGSTLRPSDGSGPTVEVEVRDVAAVLDELDVERVDLLKLNIEGGEFDVLERLIETGWVERIDDLLIQFHEGHRAAHRRRRRIRQVLTRSHVEVWDFPWVWERWRIRAR